MNRWLALLYVLALSFSPYHAAASEPPDVPLAGLPRVTVRLYNQAGLPPEVLGKATQIARKVLREAGVHVSWQDFVVTTDASNCDNSLLEENYCVVLLPNEPLVNVPVAAKGLGFVLHDPRRGVGRTAWVLYSRVLKLAGRNSVARHRLLGHVLAHELGHLLLGSAEHSRRGLMRGAWRTKDLKRAEQGALHFTDVEARTIRAALRRRATEKTSVLALVSFMPR